MIVAVRGGLGNQLFQAAFATWLKTVGGRSVSLDIRDYPNHGREFMLELCGVTFDVATDIECDQALWQSRSRWVRAGRRVAARLLPGTPEPGLVRDQPHRPSDKELLTLPDMTYLDGYWLSARYADAGKFNPPFLNTPLPGALQEYGEFLQAENSVAVHIRRGDYAQQDNVRRDYLVCDHGYFKHAMIRMTETCPGCRFLIFSDDTDYITRQNWGNLSVQALPSLPDCGDEQILQLFSKAHHQIISNSTYSWWGAYLNRRPGKRVIAPALWRRTMPSEPLRGELIPTDWELQSEGLLQEKEMA